MSKIQREFQKGSGIKTFRTPFVYKLRDADNNQHPFYLVYYDEKQTKQINGRVPVMYHVHRPENNLLIISYYFVTTTIIIFSGYILKSKMTY
ncbi:hypothetical protein ASG99_27360 [Bacillus sp. Soil768D1]|nr:hypothetical protein ASG99_27360 [Bacillus sp. Soil768D1]